MSNELADFIGQLNKIKQTEYVLEIHRRAKKGGVAHAAHAGCVKKAFYRACKDAGIDASRYTLRHTFGTRLYIDGVHEKTISDLMGHTTAKTTTRHYLKTDMDRLRDAVEMVSEQRTKGS